MTRPNFDRNWLNYLLYHEKTVEKGRFMLHHCTNYKYHNSDQSQGSHQV